MGWKLLVGGLAAVVLVRIGQRVMRPEVLFQLAQAVFVLGFTAWVAWAAISSRREKCPPPDPSARELLPLAGAVLLTTAAFFLAAWGRGLQGKEPGQALFWVAEQGAFLQAAAGAALFAFLVALCRLYLNKTLPRRDPWLFPAAVLLSGTGLALLFRLAPDLAATKGESGFFQLFELQLRSLAVSLLVLVLSVFWITTRRLESLTRKRYVYVLLSVVLIAVTALFGTEIHGRRLALDLGLMNFQTVEIVKVLALLFMVGYFRYEGGFLDPGRNRLGLPRGRYLTPYLTLWGLTLLPIFLQRDLGPTALLFALFLAVFYLGTGSGASVGFGLVAMAALGAGAYALGFPSMVRTRIDMWLDPFCHSQNLAEGLWALSGGGWFGAGMGRDLSHHIPVVQSDFSFAALAEAWGAVFSIAFIACYGLLVQRTLALARRADPPYVQLLLAGLGALWMLQAFIIIGGNIGLLPLTGITLPFVSFGGSSLLVNFLALGLVLRASNDLTAAPSST